ncbi:MAG TPA: hypothetical protein VFF28_04235 [Candidatus Nanoarchaeia archaeon]|nr:hypothetical protein [Candidatus Nanoarchaeia archaeon]
MVDIRKIIIIFVIAVLFSVLVFSVIEAVYPSPKYDEICRQNIYPEKPYITNRTCPDVNISVANRKACDEKKGYIEYTDYDENNCPTSYKCNTCQNEFNQAQQKHERVVFYISALLSLVAIFIGLYLPAESNSLNEWIGTGFMLGGTFSLFFGTLTTFIWLDRYIRPIVILLELILVIFIAYRKIGNLRQDKKK